MANKELRVKIQDAYDTEANWIANDPVLLSGQLAFSSDKYGKYKIGDGIKTWKQLEYATLSWNDITGKPSTFNPNQHNHTISQITDIGNASVKHASTAGSATNATTATKLGTATKGSATQPVYLNAGVPTACTYTLGKSVPSNAVFTDTTYSVASGSTNGLMSSTDKTKLDGIANGANKYVLPTAGLNALGGVKTTSQVTSTSGYTACPIIGGVPYYKDTNTTYTLNSFGITATAAELNFCDGVTSNIQTQLNGKAASSHTHSGYAPSTHTHTASQITGLPNVVAITNSQIDSLNSL